MLKVTTFSEKLLFATKETSAGTLNDESAYHFFFYPNFCFSTFGKLILINCRLLQKFFDVICSLPLFSMIASDLVAEVEDTGELCWKKYEQLLFEFVFYAKATIQLGLYWSEETQEIWTVNVWIRILCKWNYLPTGVRLKLEVTPTGRVASTPFTYLIHHAFSKPKTIKNGFGCRVLSNLKWGSNSFPKYYSLEKNKRVSVS